MCSVSQERWSNAQNAEKHAFNRRTIKQLRFDVGFFSKNFLVGSDYFHNKAVLEVGCTPLASIHGISNARYKVGIDPLARDWDSFYNKNTLHVQGVGECLPLPDGCVDAVLCINVLDHVRVPWNVLREIRRCLMDRRTLLLWLQTFSANNGARKLLGIVDSPHPHHFSDNEILELLEISGYRIAYHQCKKSNIHTAISLIRDGLFLSGLKSLLANLFLGLHESSFVCIKDTSCNEKEVNSSNPHLPRKNTKQRLREVKHPIQLLVKRATSLQFFEN